MSKDKATLETLVSLAKRRGFIYQGSDIYGGLSGTWDYGPLGVQLKRNLMDLWWKTFVEDREDMYGVDAAILMNRNVWQASGHTDTFTDPLVECVNCGSRFRADHIDTGKCPTCGAKDSFGEPRQFNMMFETHAGPAGASASKKSDKDSGKEEAEDSSLVYLRPETAQGIFTNYKNILDSFYPDLPFGIGQIGKAFRNEISPRDFVFRSREFEQMEVEYFVHPDKWEEAFEQWRQDVHSFLENIGLSKKDIHELEVPEDERAHYSERTIDFEFDFPHKRDELLGLAYRTDFDLKNHQEWSGKSMEYTVKGSNERFIPHVIEPSFGVERAIMAVLSSAYREDEQNGETRVYLELPKHLAPVKVAVFPLLKNKPELVEKAREVHELLSKEFGNVMFDDNGNIGKRYRRQDEIGTPWCVTVDFDSLDDGTVTLRDRNTTEQYRVAVEDLADSIEL